VRLDPRFDSLVLRDARLEKVADGFAWVEGPAWARTGSYLLFSDIPHNSVFKWQARVGASPFLHLSGYSGSAPFAGREPGSNGLTFDAVGRLVLREDLYYRLATNRVDIPPLRERSEDIPGLIDHALTEFNEKNGTHLSFHPDLVRQLQALPWPGNVRELKNLVWQIASENEGEGGAVALQMLPADLIGAVASANGLPVLKSQSVLPPAQYDADEAQRSSPSSSFLSFSMSEQWRRKRSRSRGRK
jgi:hypothetical protein